MKKYIAIVTIIIITILGYINFNNKGYEDNRDNGEPCIVIIPDTSTYVLYEDTYIEYYIIVNPPDNLIELKELIKKYDSDNPILEETKDGKKPSEYIREFFEETKHTPRDWKPTKFSDIIDDHYNDNIARISWKRDDKEKLYVLWKLEPSTRGNENSDRTIGERTFKE